MVLRNCAPGRSKARVSAQTGSQHQIHGSADGRITTITAGSRRLCRECFGTSHPASTEAAFICRLDQTVFFFVPRAGTMHRRT